MYDLPTLNTVKIDTTSIDQKGKLAFLYNALCDGTHYFDNYGIGTKIANPSRYKAFQAECVEERMVQYVAEGYDIDIIDFENDEEVVGKINLANLNQNFDKVPPNIIMDFLTENHDADTSDNFLQYIIFGELTYG